MTQYPEPVVGCFILNQKRELLLVRSYKWPGLWVVMGGHIEIGESIASAVIREVKEEVGLDVKYVRVIRVVEFINNPAFHTPKHLVGLQCECRLATDQIPVLDNDEIQEARWFSLDEAVQLPDLLDITRETIKDLLI